MRKAIKLSVWFALWLIAGIALAQTTTVSGTATDPDSIAWQNGTVTFTLTSNNPNIHPSVGGVPLTQAQQNFTINLDGTGSFSTTVFDTKFIQPISLWSIKLCPNTSSACQSLTNMQITGASQSITSTITAQLQVIRLAAGYSTRAYADVEITPVPQPGGTYYNTVQNLIKTWNGSTWTTSSAGGGGITPAQLALVPAETFGAVADWNGTTGTDNTTPLQNALNSLQNSNICGQVLLQMGGYKITAPLSITKSCVGIRGTTAGGAVGAAVTTPSPSVIITTSPTANILNIAGTDATHRILYNRFENFCLQRSVVPTSATSSGFFLNYAAGTIVNWVQSMDSARDFYFHSTPSFGIGGVDHTWASWGYNGVTETPGIQLSGYYLDSADGNAMNSLVINNSSATSPLATNVIMHGMDITGIAINDVDVNLFGSGNATIGIDVNYTGTGTLGTSSDLQFINATNDAFSKTGFLINGVVGTGAGSVNIIGGYDVSASATTDACVTISNSSGVNVSNHQITCTTNNAGLFASSSTNLTLNGNQITNNPTGNPVFFSAVTNSSFTGNTITNPAANSSILVDVTNNSKLNSFTGNTLSGFASTGFAFDGTSTNNNQIGNTIDPAHITTAINDVTGTNSPGTPGMVKIGQQTLSVLTPTVTFSSIPGIYRALQLVINGRLDASNPNVAMQFNGDTGANYNWQELYSNSASVASLQGLSATVANLGNLSGSTSGTNNAGSITATIYDYANTTFNKNVVTTNGYDFGTAQLFTIQTASVWYSTAAINSITVLNNGNFMPGSSFTLYGLN